MSGAAVTLDILAAVNTTSTGVALFDWACAGIVTGMWAINTRTLLRLR